MTEQAKHQKETGDRKIIHVGVGLTIPGDQPSSEPLRIIVTQRKKDTPYQQWWEFPGGKVEQDEMPEQCVIRELQEELGITVTILESLPIIEHQYEHGFVRLHPYWCFCPADQTPEALDVADWRWVDLNELQELQMLPANGPMIEAFLAKSQAHSSA